MLHPLRYALVRFLAALLIASGLALSLVDVRAQTEASNASSAKTSEALFDAVMEKMAERFWDQARLPAWRKRAAEMRQSIVDAPSLEEAARRIDLLLRELKISHTALLTPDDPDYYVFGGVFGLSDTVTGIGIFSVRVDGGDFVDLVLEGSTADRAGVKVGDEIVTVDGAPYHPVRSFRGKAGSMAAVALRRVPAGPIETVEVRVEDMQPLKAFSEATVASARVIERGNRRVAYIHVWASLSDADAPLRTALERVGFRSGRAGEPLAAPPDLDGLIIDMRGKIGGRLKTVVRYLELIDPRGPQVLGQRRDAKLRVRTPSMRGRTAVLIDWHTRSAAEIFVHSYKRERQGPLIGTRTAGAVTAAGLFEMPGGYRLYLATLGLTVDGEVLEGRGVAPDIEVERPLAYAGGADPVLDAAVAYLAEQAARR